MPYTPLPPEKLRRAIRVNLLAGALGMPWFAVAVGMPLILWLEWLDARGWQIGLIVAIQQLSVFFQLPSALLSERLPRHKTLWAVLAIPHRLLWIAPAILSVTLASVQPDAVIYIMMGVVALSGALGAAPTPLWYCWMGRLIPDSISGRFWGVRQATVMASFMVSMLVVGLYLDRAIIDHAAEAFAWVFGVSALLGVLDIFVHMNVPEPPIPRADIPEKSPTLRARLRVMRAHPDFMRFCFGMGAVMFAIGISGSFIPIYLKHDFAFSYSEQAMLPVCSALGTILAGLTLGRVIDRVGARSVVIGLIMIAPCTTFGWYFLHDGVWTMGGMDFRQALVVAIGIHLAGGVAYGGIGVCQLQMLSRLVPPTQRLFGTAFFWAMVGLLAALAPLIGGGVMDLMERHPIPLHLPGGHPVSFFQVLILLHILAMWTLALPLFRKLTLPPGGQPLRHHILSMIPGNAFRALVNTTTGSLSSPPSEEE